MTIKTSEEDVLACLSDIPQSQSDVAKEWLKNNFKFSLWEWFYNSIPPNNHQRQYR
jgi:hypothetical protein